MNAPNKISFSFTRTGRIAAHLYAANQADTVASAVSQAEQIIRRDFRFRGVSERKFKAALVELIPSKPAPPTYEQELASYGLAFHNLREMYRHGRICQHGEGSDRKEETLEPYDVFDDDYRIDRSQNYQPIPEIAAIKQYLREKHGLK